MAIAYWTGAYYTISSNWQNQVRALQKDWIHSLIDYKYNKTLRAWQIPIDITDISELNQNGFTVLDPRTEEVPIFPPIASPPTRPDDAEIFLPVHLFPYQLEGAKALLGGRRILADEPGVGKTRQLITVAYNLDAERVLFVVPKGAITDPWVLELTGVMETIKQNSAPITKTQGKLVVVQSKAHIKRLDDMHEGTILTTDSALSSNEEFVRWVIEWQPQIMLYDEAHRAKSFDSRVAQHLRAVAMHVPLVITASGTPYLKDTSEILTQLVLTNTIGLFGGLEAFLAEYTWEDQWHHHIGIRRKTHGINAVLDKSIWIRRTQTVAIPDMPPKLRRFISVDVPLDRVEEVHDEVVDHIDEWLADYRAHNNGYAPELSEIKEWASDNIRYITQMRVAAGVSKIDEAIRRIERWVDKYGTTRPLIVWGCYQEVIVALYERSVELGHRVGVLDGSKSRTQRDRVVSAFQAGELDLVIASIYAAGTAITLTRAHDALFVETDWTPALIVQAENRCYRLGQKETVRITTLIAKGTLDEHIQKVLTRKIAFLEQALSGDHAVSSKAPTTFAISRFLIELVQSRLASQSSPQSRLVR
ncbi:SNF2-related protein [Ferrimicrobium acidiphilum]|uniref:SNF2-related protein n=1 Tax=Ferrimicrobium acidiphilum TaxID=121039 RepID=UPI0023F3A0D8|nr:SNF2-related protein [Ferrimicrobium acidiphilum]